MPERLPLSEFRRDALKILARLKRTGEPAVLTNEGCVQVVIQDVRAYERLLTRIDELEAIEAIRQGLAEADRGESRPLRDVIREFANKMGLELEKPAPRSSRGSKRGLRVRKRSS
jgi:PHD/YefM family antitoxin component YafN of YafNO toxin-antitoxin module